MKKMISILCALLLAPHAYAGGFAQLIECRSVDGAVLTLDLYGPSSFGKPINCVYGDVVKDMTACAPDGGWGLSYSTGSASLAGITDHRTEAIGHIGGVAFSEIGPKEIEFRAAFANGDGQELKKEWAFVVNRIDGAATLSIRDTKTAFSCLAVDRIF